MPFRPLSSTLLVLLILAFAAPGEVWAQKSSTISGTVRDAAGSPLSGANVVLRPLSDGGAERGAATDSDGRFHLEAPSGRYVLRLSHVGFETLRRELELSSGEAAVFQIVLIERPILEDDMVVEALRVRPRLSPVTYSNLTSRDLEVLPAMKDIPVLLSTLPSVTFSSENGNGIGYSTMRMRGFDQRRIAIAINGIPQNDPEDFNVFWINFFDIQGAVQDIQVQRGANGAFYGPAGIGGAVNIVARPYRPEPFVEVDAGYGTYDTRRLAVAANSGLIGGRYTFFGRLSRLETDGYRDHSWSEYTRFFVGVDRQTERSRLTLQGYGGPQKDGLAFSGIPRAANDAPVVDAGAEIDRRFNPSALTNDVESFHQPHAELLHEWKPRPGLELTQAIFWVKGEGYFDFGATFRSADYLRLPDGFADLDEVQRSVPLFLTVPDAQVLQRAYLDQWQVGWLPQVSVETGLGSTRLGLEARLHRSVRWGRIEEATLIPKSVVGGDADARIYQFNGEKTIGSAFISHLARPAHWLAVQGDLQVTHRRYRIYDEHFFGNEFDTGFTFLNPRLGITVFPERPFSGYISAAVANREPRLKAIYDGEEAGAGFQPQFERRGDGSLDYDSPLVRPERLYNVEIGGTYAGRRSRLSANVFGMWFRDEIVPSGGLDQFGVPRSGNAERTRHLGIELEGEVHPVAGLELLGNLTLSRNRFVRFDEFVLIDGAYVAISRDGNPIAGFPEQTGYLGARYTRGEWTVAAGGRVAGKQYIDNSANEPVDGQDVELYVDPYALVDASLIYAFGSASSLNGLELRLDVNNVLDQRVLLYGNVGPTGAQFFPAATRHLYGGIRYTLQ